MSRITPKHAAHSRALRQAAPSSWLLKPFEWLLLARRRPRDDSD
jgi:hypothetical protein